MPRASLWFWEAQLTVPERRAIKRLDAELRRLARLAGTISARRTQIVARATSRARYRGETRQQCLDP